MICPFLLFIFANIDDIFISTIHFYYNMCVNMGAKMGVYVTTTRKAHAVENGTNARDESNNKWPRAGPKVHI